MICVFGWVPRERPREARDVALAMRDTLRAGSLASGAVWPLASGAIGVMDLVDPAPPVRSADGRLHIWAAGEVFAGLPGVDAATDLQNAAVRRALLREVERGGIEALARVNGEFQIAIWDERERSLVLACDRFGCLPLYWASTPAGLAFAGTVSAVLQAPGVSSDPDEHAIREAVTFGGFRLGDRTNVRDVRMLRGARVLVYRVGEVEVRRYWNWPAAPKGSGRRLEDLVEEAHALWRTAVRRRLPSRKQAGTTLSGGLDSRAILAEAAARGVSFRALTYGVPRCDDARLARRAAAAAGAHWTFAPLYEADWLERRTRYVAETDGLVQLVDLLHFEAFELQSALMEVNLSGYIGDVICGDTYADVVDASSLLDRLPYTGVPLAWPIDQALDWAKSELKELAPADARFALFEHKFPQAIHRIFQAPQRRIRVRRPFLDHDLFDFYARLDARTRPAVYHRMLRSRYPTLFARIPHQKTNAPVLRHPVDVKLRRIVRYGGRRLRDAVARTGLVQRAPARSYHDEERYWRVPDVRTRIVSTILRPGSICAGIFGREALTAFVNGWFRDFNGPAQSIGALYVFEHYHRTLAETRHAAEAALEVTN